MSEQKVLNFRAGAADFQQWLEDQLVYGLAAIESDPAARLEAAAQQLTDAQLPGPAAALRDFINRVGTEPHWADDLLHEFGYWHILCAQLMQAEGAELEAVMVSFGQRVRKADLLATEPTAIDNWTCTGIEQGENRNVYFRKCFWSGSTKDRSAFTLAFNYGFAVADEFPQVGTSVHSGVHAYPGGLPGRVIFPEKVTLLDEPVRPAVHHGWQAQQSFQVELLARQPWRQEMPVAVGGLVAHYEEEQLMLIDGQGAAVAIPAGSDDLRAWTVLAAAGDETFDGFGVWRNGGLQLMSIWINDRLIGV